MLDVFSYFKSLERRYGIDFAAFYFDLWFEFWSSSGHHSSSSYSSYSYRLSFIKSI